MKMQDIVAKKVYQSGGVEKVFWLPVGTLKTNDDGKQFVELNLMPGQSYYVFDRKAKEAKTPDNF